MSCSYDITVDRARRLLGLGLTGFFTPADAGRFLHEVRAAIDSLGDPPNTHVTLVDVREAKLQLQDVIAAFSNQIADPHYRSRRLAFVVGSSVARLQVRRLLDRGDVAVFDDRAEAVDWLLDPGLAVAA